MNYRFSKNYVDYLNEEKYQRRKSKVLGALFYVLIVAVSLVCLFADDLFSNVSHETLTFSKKVYDAKMLESQSQALGVQKSLFRNCVPIKAGVYCVSHDWKGQVCVTIYGLKIKKTKCGKIRVDMEQDLSKN